MIIWLVYFFAWLRSQDEAKIKNQSKQNKYADPGYNDVWAIRDGNAPYWRTHHFLMGHIKF
jgi:hypothetical protein